MSTQAEAPATVAWTDLTVPDAERIRDYYAAVVGWSFEPHDMGEYADFSMTTQSGQRVAGICFARGVNADVPPVWIPYFAVGDLEAAVARAVELGGEVVSGPRAGFCIIRDPAGAVAALYQQP